MNKFLKFLPVAAALLIATSCSKDDDSNATITPGINNTPAVEENHAPKPVPFTITVVGKSASLSKAKVVEGEDNSLTQQFTEGDVLIITGDELDKSKQSILTFSSEDVDNGTAIFTGDLYPASEDALVSGVTLTATLSNESLNNKGKSLEAPVLVSTLDEAFKQYGYLVADFTYDAGESTISLEQHTAFIVFNLPYSGAKVDVTIEGNTTTVYVSKQQVLAVPDGATVKSDLFTESLEINLDYKNSSEAVVVVFDCKRDEDLLPDNCIAGLFSVSADKQVFFSKGNLQYNPNPGAGESSWRFAPNQYDLLDNNTENHETTNYNASYDGYIDLFGWGTWLEDCNPTNVSRNTGDYQWNDNKSSAIGAEWTTLTGGDTDQAEWYYLFNSRTDADDKYGLGSIEVSAGVTVNGFILLPDGWLLPDKLEFTSLKNAEILGWDNNTYDTDAWGRMEANGAVFFPAAGDRDYGTYISEVGTCGHYWSSSVHSAFFAWILSFSWRVINPGDANTTCSGYSVRLVRSL